MLPGRTAQGRHTHISPIPPFTDPILLFTE